MPVEDEDNRGASNDWRCLLGTFPGTLGEVAFFLFLQGGGGGGMFLDGTPRSPSQVGQCHYHHSGSPVLDACICFLNIMSQPAIGSTLNAHYPPPPPLPHLHPHPAAHCGPGGVWGGNMSFLDTDGQSFLSLFCKTGFATHTFCWGRSRPDLVNTGGGGKKPGYFFWFNLWEVEGLLIFFF